jgi:hypothetical protein
VLRRGRRRVERAHLIFNVLSIPVVDLELPIDSRIGLRCHGPVVCAFRPEWDRNANPSSGKPPARKTLLCHREAACTALASRERAWPAATGAPSPASGAVRALGLAHPLQRRRHGGRVDLGHAREIDHAGAMPEILLGLRGQPRHRLQGYRPLEQQHLPFASKYHALSGLAPRFFDTSVLIRPSMPDSLT